jgi:hypothetical protein
MNTRTMGYEEAKLFLNIVVDFVLNSYQDGATAQDLGAKIDDQETADYIFEELRVYSVLNPAKYRKLFAPEPGDVTIRSWVYDILSK